MRIALFAAALMMGTAALAQNDPGTEPMPGDATTADDTQPADTMEPAQPADPMNPPAPVETMTDPAMPATTDQGTMPSQGTMPTQGSMPMQGAARDYPPCSRTVTDSCIQTNERGRRPR